MSESQLKQVQTSDIAYTVGEPGGIGADIILQLAQQQALADVICIGDAVAIQHRARLLGVSITLLKSDEQLTKAGELRVLHVPVSENETCGQALTSNVSGVMAMLDCAIDGCLTGQYAAVVTGPLHKGVINDAGFSFSGHTEYLAERTNSVKPVMLLASDQLRVALMTTHLPLKDVSKAITANLIDTICRIIDHDLQHKFGIKNPRQLICGLNPHAGEDGHLGREEIDIIIPALQKLQKDGIDVVGPLPADTLFSKKNLDSADVVVAMYHDQGLPVIKAQSFGNAANITLGLPIIRTSVDHGTAFDLAGTAKADIGSLKTALNVARDMVSSQP